MLVTRIRLTTSSRAQPSLACLRHTSCRFAVRKPCGLKKPASQKEAGRPERSQPESCSARLMTFENQTPRLGACICDTAAHAAGTRARKSAPTASASSGDIMMVPAIASFNPASCARTSDSTFCRRSDSCLRQMLSGLVGPMCFSAVFTSSGLKSAGNLACSSVTCSETTSSRVAPPPPPPSLG
eukprot:6188274-Pleurochrysis_carterae.AAC.2